MQVTETLSEGLKRGFTVVVPSETLENRRSAKLSELGRQVRLPGFRPGKVPDKLIRQRYGTAVMAEVLEDSVQEAMQQVLSDRGLRPATQPKVDVKTLPEPAGEASDLEFSVEVELLPDIAVPDFANLHLTRLTAEPGAEQVDRALADLAARQRTLEPVAEPRPAQKGEFLTVDYTGRVEGVAFPGGTATDVDIEVGGQGFIPGFTEQIEGMTPGETKTIEVTFPENYGTKDLAGRNASFEIVAKALKTPSVPPVDDALAEKIGFDTLDELRAALTRQMKRDFDGMTRMRLKRELLDKLSDQADFPAPPSMVEGEFNQIWKQIEGEMKAGRLEEADRAKDEETLKSEYRTIAERRVRLGLLLAEIGRAQGVQVTAEEMARAMRTEAMRYAGQEAQVMEFFRKNPQAADSLRGPVFEDKVVDYILDQAAVEERVVSFEELSADPEDAKAEAAAPESLESAE